MTILATISHWLFDPPKPPCDQAISPEEEAKERQLWRDAIHGNKGALSRTDAAAQNTSREVARDAKNTSEAERVLDDMIKMVQRGRDELSKKYKDIHDNEDRAK